MDGLGATGRMAEPTLRTTAKEDATTKAGEKRRDHGETALDRTELLRMNAVGGPPTISRSASSTSWTTRSCASPCAPGTSSRSHLGTTPGLNFVYVHLNRAIERRDLNCLHVASPGHGDPGLVADTHLEGTYSEVYQTSRRPRPG